MDNDIIADLKQFIAAAVSQQTSDITARLDTIEHQMATKQDLSSSLTSLETRLTTRISDLQSSVADGLDTSNDAADSQLQDHEQRLTRLEQRVA